MKKVFLHIGFHKTGTSALQEYLSNNRSRLESRDCLYPESFEGKYPGNVDLSWAFAAEPPEWASITADDSSQVLEHYRKQISETRCNNIVVSSEDFAALDADPSSIKRVKDFFADYDVRVIAYLRHPVDFIVSLYSHAVRERVLDCSLKEYISEHFRFRATDYPLRLRSWISVFGKESVIVKKYAVSDFSENSLAKDFFETIGFEFDLEAVAPVSNSGVHPWLIDAYIQVSKSELDEGVKHEKLQQLLELGLGLPKVSAAKYLLAPEDLRFLDNVLLVTRNRMRNGFGIDFY